MDYNGDVEHAPPPVLVEDDKARIGGGFTGNYGTPASFEVRPQEWSATYTENGVVVHSSGTIDGGADGHEPRGDDQWE